MCSTGGRGNIGSNQKVPDTRKAKASQEPIGMTLAEIPHKGERELVESSLSANVNPRELSDTEPPTRHHTTVDMRSPAQI